MGLLDLINRPFKDNIGYVEDPQTGARVKGRQITKGGSIKQASNSAGAQSFRHALNKTAGRSAANAYMGGRVSISDSDKAKLAALNPQLNTPLDTQPKDIFDKTLEEAGWEPFPEMHTNRNVFDVQGTHPSYSNSYVYNETPDQKLRPQDTSEYGLQSLAGAHEANKMYAPVDNWLKADEDYRNQVINMDTENLPIPSQRGQHGVHMGYEQPVSQALHEELNPFIDRDNVNNYVMPDSNMLIDDPRFNAKQTPEVPADGSIRQLTSEGDLRTLSNEKGYVSPYYGEDNILVTSEGGVKNPNGSMLMKAVDNLTELIGYPLKFNSGYRPPGENRGAKRSRHLNGIALDINVSKLNMQQRGQLAVLAHQAGFNGIGFGDNIMHIDLRPQQEGVIWSYRNGKHYSIGADEDLWNSTKHSNIPPGLIKNKYDFNSLKNHFRKL